MLTELCQVFYLSCAPTFINGTTRLVIMAGRSGKWTRFFKVHWLRTRFWNRGGTFSSVHPIGTFTPKVLGVLYESHTRGAYIILASGEEFFDMLLGLWVLCFVRPIPYPWSILCGFHYLSTQGCKVWRLSPNCSSSLVTIEENVIIPLYIKRMLECFKAAWEVPLTIELPVVH